MKSNAVLTLLFLLVLACTASTAFAQTETGTSASATGATVSSGRPSTIQIRQQILQQQQARLENQLREIQRCIRTSRLRVVLIDVEGRTKRVPKTDLVNCGRRLQQLLRQLSTLAGKADDLARDAQFQAILLEDALRQQQREEALRALRGGSQSTE
jgi:TolA-binding protein